MIKYMGKKQVEECEYCGQEIEYVEPPSSAELTALMKKIISKAMDK